MFSVRNPLEIMMWRVCRDGGLGVLNFFFLVEVRDTWVDRKCKQGWMFFHYILTYHGPICSFCVFSESNKDNWAETNQYFRLFTVNSSADYILEQSTCAENIPKQTNIRTTMVLCLINSPKPKDIEFKQSHPRS